MLIGAFLWSSVASKRFPLGDGAVGAISLCAIAFWCGRAAAAGRGVFGTGICEAEGGFVQMLRG
jgi:hypothetical protein